MLKTIILLFIIFILLILGISYFLFRSLFFRPKRSTKIPKYYIGTPHYKVSRAGMAYMKERNYEDIYIHSHDGLKLHAYLFKADQKTNKYVIGMHGYRSYARPEYAPYIQFYHKLGYNMLLPDDRGHAPSEGKYIGFGILDRLDCVNWAKYLVTNYGENVEILLHGVSMGAATVLAASGEEDLPVQVKGIISDCGFSSARAILTYQFKHMAHIPVFPFLNVIELFAKHLAGYDFEKFSAIEQVKKSTTPILFVQGGKDQMVPPFMVHQLYDACVSKKRLLFVEEAGHGESIAFKPEDYYQAIHEFFNI